MLARTPTARPRRGVTIVESTLVLGIFLMILFALFEYCRFLMVLHLTNNAARDGARYASVNLSKPANFDTADFTDAGGTVYPSVTKYTTDRMGGTQNNVQGFTVTATARTQAGVVIGGRTWNQVSFPERVAVSVTGVYRPVVPLQIFTGRMGLNIIPDNIPVNATAVVSSEG